MKNENRLVIPLFVLSVLSFFLVGAATQGFERMVIPASFELSEKIGLGSSGNEMVFGAMKTNQSATRNVKVSNDFDYDIFVKIKSSGDIKDRIIASENNFVLGPDESREVSFTVYTNGLTELGKYDGEIIILSKKV